MSSSSAWSAPLAFIACRMEIVSRGVAPTALSAPTMSLTFAVAGRTIVLPELSLTLTFVLFATIVLP